MLLAMLIAFAGCGVEREDVKTLTDSASRKLVGPREAAIEDLLQLPKPRWRRSARRHRFEHAVVTVEAKVIAYRNESDGDLHVIISGERHGMMVAEFPDAACSQGSRYSGLMKQARRTFTRLAKRGVTRMRLTGVLFFDKLHGQLGGAPNGVELHPVLRVEPVRAIK